MLTMFKEERLFNEAMDAGFLGYVLKENAASDLVECIHAVAAGRAFISPVLSPFLLQRGERVKTLATEKPGLEKLTPAEQRIIKLIAADFTSKEIAEKLGLSPHTVENHRSNISAKLGLSGSHSLLKFAYDNKSSL
jgi:DNA-binding NarL/FixJ family response regulator